MFQFRRFPSCDYLIHHRMTEYGSAGLPHSEISGSKPMCGSPKLIAACHVLRRLLMPRHPPCALIRLTFPRSYERSVWFSRIMQASLQKFEIVSITQLQLSFAFAFLTVLSHGYLSLSLSFFLLFSFQGAVPASQHLIHSDLRGFAGSFKSSSKHLPVNASISF